MEKAHLKPESSKDFNHLEKVKSIQEKPALLSVHEALDGQYIIRVNDMRYRSLVSDVAKLLTNARSVVLITPNDIKVFDVNGSSIVSGSEVHRPDEEEPEVDAETIAEIAKQESIQTPNQEVVGETKQGTKVVRRKRNLDGGPGHDESCGRCRGSGQIQTLMDGGTPATATCPVCQGSGVMKRYGNRR